MAEIEACSGISNKPVNRIHTVGKLIHVYRSLSHVKDPAVDVRASLPERVK